MIRLHYQKQYYQENKEQIKKYTKHYYELNKNKLKKNRKGKLPVKKKEKDCQFFRIEKEVTLSFR